MKSILIEPQIHDDLAEFFPLWRDACLGRIGSEEEEIKFLQEVFASPTQVRNIIDLGGSVGLHTVALQKTGFDVTLFDQSSSALAIARRHCPNLPTINGDFGEINIGQRFDAAISMFSSVNYLVNESERMHFYHWLSNQINDLVILDQVNVRRLPRSYSDNCQSEDKHFRLNILREWYFEGEIMHTSFVYEFIDKESGAAKIINDKQAQRFLTLDELSKYMGNSWRILTVLGDCSLRHPFDPDTSSRMISIFKHV